MSIQRIAVCEAQVPFVRGGAEYLVRTLVAALRERGYDTELVSIPFKWYPKDELLTSAAAWRLIDLSESNGRPIDLVIATKFPTYFVRHPNKVAWLMHQYRSASESVRHDVQRVHAHGRRRRTARDAVPPRLRNARECRRVFTISKNIATRLDTFNGLSHAALYPPSPFSGRLEPGSYGGYILSVGRLESVKRPDLIVRAMCHVNRPLRLVVVGSGTMERETQALAESLGVSDRIDFRGALEERDLLNLYKDALAIVYTPYDEDYGYVTLEAFLSRKPVVTVTDAGGPLEFVEDGVSGFVCAPEPEAIASAINRLAANRGRAATLGDAGFERARAITWDAVIDRLVE